MDQSGGHPGPQPAGPGSRRRPSRESKEFDEQKEPPDHRASRPRRLAVAGIRATPRPMPAGWNLEAPRLSGMGPRAELTSLP